jgi:hypothetical protein
MNFTAPLPFTEAMQSREIRSILRTTGNTAQLATLEPAVRERAIFSATVTSAEFLDGFDRRVQRILSGQLDQATARLELKQLLAGEGYTADASVAGTLQDLRTDERLNLIIETNVELARGYGQWLQGQDPAVLDEWPARELIRVRHSEKPRDWAERWAEAGGQFFDGRMIALANDPIWRRISRFDLPYAPFDFNSGMDTHDVARADAVELGLLDESTVLLPQSRDFNADLQASPTIRSNWLIDALENSGVGEFNDKGVFVFKPGGAE